MFLDAVFVHVIDQVVVPANLYTYQQRPVDVVIDPSLFVIITKPVLMPVRIPVAIAMVSFMLNVVQVMVDMLPINVLVVALLLVPHANLLRVLVDVLVNGVGTVPVTNKLLI